MHFADLHAVLADASGGSVAAAWQRIAGMRERLASGRLPHGEVVPALSEGIVAFCGGDYAAAADLIGPMIPEVVRVGGSHAQRELFEDTHLVACMRAGRNGAAKELLTDRLAHRPSARDQRWLAAVG
ncbi:MAG: hypothetical protein AB7U95_13635 [Reyranella sp.]